MSDYPGLHYLGEFASAREAWTAGAVVTIDRDGRLFGWSRKPDAPHPTMALVNHMGADFREPEQRTG